jgi:hypothetical protein
MLVVMTSHRPQWSTEDGEPSAAPTATDGDGVQLPGGCTWGGGWVAEHWEYALDFPAKMSGWSTKKRLSDCVRRRVWSRPVLVTDPRLLGSGGLTTADLDSAAAASSGGVVGGQSRWKDGRSFRGPATVVFTGASSGGDGDGAAAGAGGDGEKSSEASFCVVDEGKLFLLSDKKARKALRVVALGDIASVTPVHPLEAGVEHALAVVLDGRANPAEKGHTVQIIVRCRYLRLWGVVLLTRFACTPVDASCELQVGAPPLPSSVGGGPAPK